MPLAETTAFRATATEPVSTGESPSQSPLSLNDQEYNAIMQAAAPIHPAERGLFLLKMAETLAQYPIVGEGLVHRIASDLQRRYVVQARVDAVLGKGETHRHRLQPRKTA